MDRAVRFWQRWWPGDGRSPPPLTRPRLTAHACARWATGSIPWFADRHDNERKEPLSSRRRGRLLVSVGLLADATVGPEVQGAMPVVGHDLTRHKDLRCSVAGSACNEGRGTVRPGTLVLERVRPPGASFGVQMCHRSAFDAFAPPAWPCCCNGAILGTGRIHHARPSPRGHPGA